MAEEYSADPATWEYKKGGGKGWWYPHPSDDRLELFWKLHSCNTGFRGCSLEVTETWRCTGITRVKEYLKQPRPAADESASSTTLPGPMTPDSAVEDHEAKKKRKSSPTTRRWLPRGHRCANLADLVLAADSLIDQENHQEPVNEPDDKEMAHDDKKPVSEPDDKEKADDEKPVSEPDDKLWVSEPDDEKPSKRGRFA